MVKNNTISINNPTITSYYHRHMNHDPLNIAFIQAVNDTYEKWFKIFQLFTTKFNVSLSIINV
jgi:hypothetical protein